MADLMSGKVRFYTVACITWAVRDKH
jgi:hypothetical protein